MIKFVETAKQTIGKVSTIAKKLKWRLKNQWDNKLNAIERAIALSEDEFSLSIALYTSKKQRDKWVKKLSHEQKIITVKLDPSAEKLMPEIIEAIENANSKSSAIFVTGIETIDVETVFSDINENRESFYKLKTPMVL